MENNNHSQESWMSRAKSKGDLSVSIQMENKLTGKSINMLTEIYKKQMNIYHKKLIIGYIFTNLF